MESVKKYHSNSNDKKLDSQEYVDLSCCSDAHLWEQFKLGNKSAFDRIYDTFFQPLCCYGDRICEDKSLVEDVVQDLFIYLWTKRENLGKTDAIKYYLFRCLRRKLLRVLTQEKRREDKFPIWEKEPHPFQLSLNLSFVPTSEEEEIQNKLTIALGRLTDRQKEAIYLKFYNNLSFQEVASIMELEVRSVYNLISRTIDVLRADLKHQGLSTPQLISFVLPFLVHAW